MKVINIVRVLIGAMTLIAAVIADSQTTQAAGPPKATATATLSAAGEGRRLFLKLNCYGCHGMRAGGGMGPNIVGQEAGDVLEKMRTGADGGMPAYSAAYATSINANYIAAYLLSIGTPSEPKFMDWWVAVPTK